MDGADKEVFLKWSNDFIQIIEQIDFMEKSEDLPSQLTGLSNQKDFNFRKITTGVSSLKNTYEEAKPFYKELEKLSAKYPNMFRELKIEFLTLMIRTDEIYDTIEKVSGGGKFTQNGKKQLHGWIRKELDNVMDWVKRSQGRKELLRVFLTKNKKFISLRNRCYDKGSINLPSPPIDKNEFDEWLRKYRSNNKKELSKILIKKPETKIKNV